MIYVMHVTAAQAITTSEVLDSRDEVLRDIARGTEPDQVARGHEAFRELLETMHESRIKRLLHAGFTAEQAEAISTLHTPNFM